jgi:integrase
MEMRPGLKDVRRPAAPMNAYIVLSLLSGIRTEEARALRWAHVDLDGDLAARPPLPPHPVAGEQLAAGESWQDTGLVFTTHHGAALDAGNVRRMFKRICTEAGGGDGWAPRELRTSFVSVMSHRGVSIKEIACLAGHAITRTTEIVYRRELRPVITTGAEIMDQLFTGT